MSKVRLITLAMAFCFLGGVSVASAATPPKIPGKTYFPTADGCGFLISDAELAKAEETTKQYWQQQSSKHWIGTCLHGLVDGRGYWFNPEATGFNLHFYSGSYVLGEDPFHQTKLTSVTYDVVLPNKRIIGSVATAGQIEYQIFDWQSFEKNEGKGPHQSAFFPVIWKESMRSVPVFNLNDGGTGDDVIFKFNGTLPANEKYDSDVLGEMSFEAVVKSCDKIKVKIKGCSPPGNVFDVYGISIEGIAHSEVAQHDARFIPCPNPRSSSGCDVLWESSVGKYIDAMKEHASFVARKRLEENQHLEKLRQSAMQALPSAWKAHWVKNVPNRTAVDMALNCYEVTDYGPISMPDAQYIQNKYSSARCNSSVVAQAVLQRIAEYIQAENKSISYRSQQIANLEKYNRERAQARSEAWAGFFNSMNAVLQVQLQVEQQRIDQANAQLAAQAAAANAAPAPTYQSYGQPAASSPQSYDPSKVQTRKIHKPELEASSCVKLVQLANGDPLSSFGSQVFSNQCGQTVEVFWCKVGDECERGAGGMQTLGSGKSWPVTSGEYLYGACLGANSGGMVKESNGEIRGRHACTGP